MNLLQLGILLILIGVVVWAAGAPWSGLIILIGIIVIVWEIINRALAGRPQ